MTNNLASIEGVEVDSHGGWCPVQVEGTIDGLAFYFRARGDHWTVTISMTAEPVYAYELASAETYWATGGYYGHGEQAGWMDDEHAEACIRAAIEAWRARGGASSPHGLFDTVDTPTRPL